MQDPKQVQIQQAFNATLQQIEKSKMPTQLKWQTAWILLFLFHKSNSTVVYKNESKALAEALRPYPDILKAMSNMINVHDGLKDQPNRTDITAAIFKQGYDVLLPALRERLFVELPTGFIYVTGSPKNAKWRLYLEREGKAQTYAQDLKAQVQVQLGQNKLTTSPLDPNQVFAVDSGNIGDDFDINIYQNADVIILYDTGEELQGMIQGFQKTLGAHRVNAFKATYTPDHQQVNLTLVKSDDDVSKLPQKVELAEKTMGPRATFNALQVLSLKVDELEQDKISQVKLKK